ncbi:RHS repeat protein [Shewanella sp. DC2-4]|uniref:RHS repeat domain-containing protein n=1 Tax=Shewanella sp. DC2-4 TaxID=2739431 RepID=UPI0015652338|nr:RHS repeat domain-containing protein [Shewanella sp. DC2-4]NRD30253.1 RHS repeat protein [Shewanella sp. DC2-4]
MRNIQYELHHNTPEVAVMDNRGLTVRTLRYHRHPDSPTVTDERITRHHFNALGQLTHSIDPRLWALQQADATVAPNVAYVSSLTGDVLRSEGVDNGITVALNDAAGRPYLAVSNISTAGDGTENRSQAVTRTWQYEDATLPGRPVSVTEQATGEASRITERFVYAGNTDAEKDQNLASVCVSHYDTAGLVQTDSIALTGVPHSVTRRLLKDADNSGTVADWQGEDASAWNDQLDAETYSTLTTADSIGAVLSITDAQGNIQRVAYDVAGLLSGSWLTVKGGKEQPIVVSLTYSAAGQKLREEHGNGVVTTYMYEAETQRLTGIKTERPAGHAAGTKVLQDLRYEYDPVGNVLKITNDAEKTRFWRNQKVVPENTYVYDSLYQLVSATGREMANASQQGSNLPSATVPLPTDSSAYTNYTRTYTYDEAGNLTQVRHTPATGSGYTTNITVSDRSNRGVLSTLTENAADVDALFTAGGQQKQLQPGQSLAWTPRNELLKVTPVEREGDIDDRESYRYDAGSQRLLKVSVQKANTTIQTQRTLYLPGLELHTTQNGNTEMEGLQVITVGEAGCAQVRMLHWESGRPDSISNDQLRYSYDNLTGSSGLELDGDGNVISMEEYYPYGGTAVWTARSAVEADYKTVRYSGKERDATGLYYYGYRYYQPWAGRWLSSDPAGTVDGLNLFRMVRNNPVTMQDIDGLAPGPSISIADRIRQLNLRDQAKESSPSQSRPVFMEEKLPTPSVSTKEFSLVAEEETVNVSSQATPDLAIPVTENITIDGRKKFTLYRADGRTFEELQNKYPEGFKSWVPLNTEQARKLASIFTGSKDMTGLPNHLIDNINKWGDSPKLADLSTYIKYTKDRSTVWVSTAINTEAGGQSSGAPLYEISMELFESKIVKKNAVLAPEGRKKNMEFSLLTDMPDISQSSIIALNHGPLGDEEISFITRIPLSNVKPYSARR